MGRTLFLTTLLTLVFLGAPSSDASAAASSNDNSSSNSPAPIEMQELSWEEYWVDTGQSKSSRTSVGLPAHLFSQEDKLVHASHSLLRRRKRLIYGEDDRVRIDPALDGQKFPYSAQMRVSTGCSGIMITTHHVLTAAHCVHDGIAFLPSALYFLRAGYLEPGGNTKWFFVRRFFIPNQWKNLTTSNVHAYGNWDDFDIAVLEMVSGLGEKRDFISPGLSGLFCDTKKSFHGAGSKVDYVSFPDDKSDEAMWYVQTDIMTESLNLIYFRGAAWHGSSGAGMFVWEYDKEKRKYNRVVIGVLSGNRNTEALAKMQGNFNVGVRLNPLRFALVCHWIGTWESCQQRYKKYLDSSSQHDLCN